MYYILNRHRDFCAARGKEPNFYSDEVQYEKGEAFFWKDRFSHYRGECIAGDFSTSYMSNGKYRTSLKHIFASRSPRRTFFSTCVRHPVLWHWSHYLHRVRNVDGFRSLPPVTGTFADYLEESFSRNRLTTFDSQIRMLKRIYWGPFSRRNLLILVYERDVGPDLSIAYSKICGLLSIDPANFEPIKGIVSSERRESDEIVTEWNGPGTFANVKANRAYLPAVYQATAAGVSEKGVEFSVGDIIIERDPTHISVIRNPDDETTRRYLGYFNSVSTELTVEELEEFSERYFKDQIRSLTSLLGGNIPEWETKRLNLSQTEKAEQTYA